MATAPVIKEKAISEVYIIGNRLSREGLPVTLEANVKTPTGTPTGTVTFRDEGRSLGTATLNDSGIATLTVSGFAWGSHRIVASYSGNEHVCESNSPPVSHKVRLGWKNLQHIWSCIQSFFTVLALLAAGIWALHRWDVEREPSLQITVTAQQDTQEENQRDGFLIRGQIKVENVGSKRTLISLEDGPLFIAKVISIPCGASLDAKKPDDTSKVKLGESKKFWLSRPLVDDPRRPDYENLDQIRRGTDVFSFMVRVPEPGIYAILFSPGAPEESGAIKELPYPARWEPPAIFVDVKSVIPLPSTRIIRGESTPKPCST